MKYSVRSIETRLYASVSLCQVRVKSKHISDYGRTSQIRTCLNRVEFVDKIS